MKSFQLGFTIIETMLFLAITGLLMAGILATAGTSVNLQRYNDSVRSLQNRLKKVYNDTINVSNDRNSSQACSKGSNAINIVNAQSNVGQSDCVLIGKYITNSNSNLNNTTITVSDVLGYYDENTTSGTDVADFKNYLFTIYPGSQDSYSLEWGSSIYSLTSSNSQSSNFSILVLRSPISGLVKTFVDSSKSYSQADIGSLVRAAYLNKPAKICVDPNGLFSTGSKMAVSIEANSTSSSGVDVLGDNSGC